MRATDAGWVFADAWVLTAIAIARPPCDLPELIGVADGINHAIILEDEVESALGKLSGAGLLQINDDWTFELTEAGRELVARRRGNLFSQVDSIVKLLARIDPGTSPAELPSGAMARAVTRYRDRMPR